MPRSADDSGMATRLRAAASDLLELAQIRLELFALETREAFLHLMLLAVFAVGGAIILCAGLVFLTVFITVLLWDVHRLWALGAFAVLFLVSGVVLLRLTWMRVRGLARLFTATCGELQRDRERLRTAPVVVGAATKGRRS